MVEYHTTNGHTVLLDAEDMDTLWPTLVAGLRLQSVARLDGLSVILTEYRPRRTMLLSKALTGATEQDEVRFINGNRLDHRRANLRRVETPRRQGWASLTHAAQRLRD